MVGLPYDLLANPLGAVRLSFEKAVASLPPDYDPAAFFRSKDFGAVDLFQDFIFEQGGLAQVPILDESTIRWVQPNTLVRFRGMIQDMLGNELYIGAFKDGSTWRTNKFTDVAPFPIPPACESQFWERHLFYCVPVPGQNSWTMQPSPSPGARSVSCYTPQREGKRRRSIEDDDLGLNVLDEGGLISSSGTKKQKEDEYACHTSFLSCDMANQGAVLELKHGDSRRLSCLVKIYDTAESHLKLNDIFEFIGIYTFDPELAVQKDDSDDPMLDELFEDPASHLPPNKVPRLHCLICRKLDVQDFLPISLTFEPLPTTIRGIRESLLVHLTAVLGNDSVAAQYLLLHFLSRVHARVDFTSVGKFSLNLTGFTRESSSIFGNQVTEAIQKLLPFTQAIPLTIDYLNNATLQPRKNNQTGRLVSGVLQLAHGTHLTIDETCLQSGTLAPNGIENVRLFKDLLELQKVEYEFEYYKLEMPADVKILVLSEGKSNIIPADLVLPLRPNSIASVNATLVELEAWRWYLATARSFPHSSEPEINQVRPLKSWLSFDDRGVAHLYRNFAFSGLHILADEMVAAMREDRSLGGADLNRLLTMAELMCASFGEKSLTLEHWRMAMELERLRKGRLKGNAV